MMPSLSLFRILGALCLALVAGAPVLAWQGEAYFERRDREAFAAAETFAILPDGRRLRIRDRGEVGPPILLVGGMAATLETWTALDAALPKEQRVVSYDRSGIGFSDPDPAPPSADRAADEMLALLDSLAISSPVVPICFSLGGLFCHRFAAKYPYRVAGMILLDPTHPDEWSRVAYASAQANIWEFLTVVPRRALKSTFGIPRAVHAIKDVVRPGPSQDRDARKAVAIDLSGSHWSAVERESTSIFRFHDEIRATPLPPTLPLIVFSSLGADRPEVEQIVHELHRDWSAQSSLGQFVLVRDTDHAGLRDDPTNARVIASATKAMIEQIRPAVGRL